MIWCHYCPQPFLQIRELLAHAEQAHGIRIEAPTVAKPAVSWSEFSAKVPAA